MILCLSWNIFENEIIFIQKMEYLINSRIRLFRAKYVLAEDDNSLCVIEKFFSLIKKADNRNWLLLIIWWISLPNIYCINYLNDSCRFEKEVYMSWVEVMRKWMHFDSTLKAQTLILFCYGIGILAVALIAAVFPHNFAAENKKWKWNA